MVKRMICFMTVLVMLFVAGCTNSDDSTASGTEQNRVSAKVSVSGTDLVVNGKKLWVNGVNTPWQYWNDFCGDLNEAFWERTFETLSSDGVNCTRIWVNCNGENVVRLKSTGEVKSINEAHWTDLDKLFAIAKKHRVYVMPTLLSFDHFKNSEKWQALGKSKAAVDSYAEQYVAEFAKRYGDNEWLLGIDLMNEPDWVNENEECGRLSWDDLGYLFGKCSQTIHENSSALVTVGIGVIKYNSEKYNGNMISDEKLIALTGSDKAPIDFYSTHYYLWQKPYYGTPFEVSPEQFGLDGTKPSLVGENSNDDEAEIGMTLTEKYKSMHDKGWDGLMVWMEYREDDEKIWYRYDLTETAVNAMKEYIPDEVYLTGTDKEEQL